MAHPALRTAIGEAIHLLPLVSRFYQSDGRTQLRYVTGLWQVQVIEIYVL